MRRKADAAPGAEEEVAAVFNTLRRLVHALHTASNEAQRTLGITGAQLFVLTQLRESPQLSINDLAAVTMTHQSTVSVVVRRLERRKLVKKVRAADDARRVELSLTPAGTALLRRAPEPIQTRLARAIAELAGTERRALARGLSHLNSEIAQGDGAPGLFFE